MTKKEAAALLGVTERTLARWTAQSKIGVRYERGKNGDVAVYDRGELERFKADLERPTHRPAVQRFTPSIQSFTPGGAGPSDAASAGPSASNGAPGAPMTTGDTHDTGIFHPLSPLPDAAQLDALARLLAAIGVTTTLNDQPRPLAGPPGQAPQDQASQDQARPVVPVADKLLLTLAEVQGLTGLSRAVLRQAIKDGALQARPIGKAWRVTRTALESYVAALDAPDRDAPDLDTPNRAAPDHSNPPSQHATGKATGKADSKADGKKAKSEGKKGNGRKGRR
jgi:Helix-turn-helix domain